MPLSPDYRDYVLEQLGGLHGLRSRRMFGGLGLYCEHVFFGLLSRDVLYFKVGEANRSHYEARGARPFRPYADRPELSFSFFEVPADVLEDAETCVDWARAAVAAALASRDRPRRRARRGRSPRVSRGCGPGT